MTAQQDGKPEVIRGSIRAARTPSGNVKLDTITGAPSIEIQRADLDDVIAALEAIRSVRIEEP